MKINIIAALLVASHAYTIAMGSIIDGTCEKSGVLTEQDCNTKCNYRCEENKWTGSVSGPPDAITKCTCTCSISGFTFTCKQPPDDPDPPVDITEDCEERDIQDRDDCKAECITLADGKSWYAHVDGGMGNISACYCDYGVEKENHFTCTRDPTPPPPIPETRSGRCSESSITDQGSCFAFCLKYDRSPQYVGTASGLLKCRCRDGNGGDIIFECRKGEYLRAN